MIDKALEILKEPAVILGIALFLCVMVIISQRVALNRIQRGQQKRKTISKQQQK